MALQALLGLAKEATHRANSARLALAWVLWLAGNQPFERVLAVSHPLLLLLISECTVLVVGEELVPVGHQVEVDLADGASELAKG